MKVRTRVEMSTVAATPRTATAGATQSIRGHHAAGGNQTRPITDHPAALTTTP